MVCGEVRLYLVLVVCGRGEGVCRCVWGGECGDVRVGGGGLRTECVCVRDGRECILVCGICSVVV